MTTILLINYLAKFQIKTLLMCYDNSSDNNKEICTQYH